MTGLTDLTIVVLAKSPAAGRSKTRLAPAYGFEGAAALAAASLADTLAAVAASAATRRLLVLDGAPVPAVPAGFAVVPQVAGGHARRIAAALALADGPALLVGMDTPQVTPELLAVDLTARADAWLGPAWDGGWWALGLRDPRRFAGRVVSGVPMSTARTGEVQRRRLLQAGLVVVDLPPLRDVDEPADAEAVAAGFPATRFAAALAALGASRGVRR
jgi:glycosyltransferase A (GT-A) superfamily protein (DUF2064 family)